MDFPRLSKIFSPFPEKAGCIIVVKSSQADGCVNVTSIKKRKISNGKDLFTKDSPFLATHKDSIRMPIRRFVRPESILVRTRENVMHA